MARKTKEEAQATRCGLLDAAERLFLAQGVSRTSLQDIASAAGVTRGAVYWHFKDKSDLFNAMMDRVILPMEATCAGLDTTDDRPVLPFVRQLMIDLFRRVSEDEQLRRVLAISLNKMEDTDELSAVRERRVQLRQAFRDRLAGALQRAQARGEVSAAWPARSAALGLHALVDGLLQYWLLDPAAFDLRQVGAQAIDVHLAGLAQGPAAG